MKEFKVGTVKWFGGYNSRKDKENNFGFIQPDDFSEDVYVHENNLNCLPIDLEEDAIVIFEVKNKKQNKKKEAFNVRLADLNKKLDLLLCLNSMNEDILRESIEILLTKNEKVDNEMAELLHEKLSFLDSNSHYNSTQELIELMPDCTFLEYPSLRDFLNSKRHIKILCSILTSEKNEVVKEMAFHELKELIIEETPISWKVDQNGNMLEDSWKAESPYAMDTWNLVPDEILFDSEIYKLVPDPKKISTLLTHWNETTDVSHKDKLFDEFLGLLKNPSNHNYIPYSLKEDKRVFTLLKSIEQVKLGWQNIHEFWHYMNRDAKIYAIFRASKENKNLEIANYFDEEKDLLVKMLLLLLGRKIGIPGGLKEAHYMLEEYVQNQAWKSTKPLDLGPLLAGCDFLNINCCEARKWPTKEGGWKEDENGNEQAFCPRKQKPCPIITDKKSQGAHVYAIVNRDWTNWTLTEFFHSLNIQPNSEELRRQDTYPLKIAGWINRLNEIRERMKCEECESVLRPNKKYAFHPAKYNSTVAYCPNNHGEGIYFNHCWNCSYIIDSRESSVKFESYYLCIKCGAGPNGTMKSWSAENLVVPKATTFYQGAKCPKCGTSNMEATKEDKDIKECVNQKCGHFIHLKGRSTSKRTRRKYY